MKAHSRSPCGMPSSGMTQIFKPSLVSLRELEPKSWFTLRDSKSPAASRMWLWISTLHPSQGQYSRGSMLRRSTPTSFHRNHICSFVHHLLVFCFVLFSVGAALLLPVYFNLDSIRVMYCRRYWEVSNSIVSLELDRAGRKGER